MALGSFDKMMVVPQKNYTAMPKFNKYGEEMVLVCGMWIEVSKAPARMALLRSWHENAVEREKEAERDIMERAARTGETPDMIRRELRTEMHTAMVNAGFGISHHAR